MNTTDVHGAFREMWETRPARPRDDRQVAGVAAAIARRYDIDPVLVRVGFVVAAFFGIGAALYIAGWIVLPDAPADPAVPESRKRGLLVVGLGSPPSCRWGRSSAATADAGASCCRCWRRSRCCSCCTAAGADRGVPGPGRAAGLDQPPTAAGGPSQSWPPQAAEGATAQVPAHGVSLVKGVSATSPPPRRTPSRRPGTRWAPPRSPGTSPSPRRPPRPRPPGAARR